MRDKNYHKSFERHMNQLDAHLKGKKTWITIPNPNPNETNKRFIRVSGDKYFKNVGGKYSGMPVN